MWKKKAICGVELMKWLIIFKYDVYVYELNAQNLLNKKYI